MVVLYLIEQILLVQGLVGACAALERGEPESDSCKWFVNLVLNYDHS